MHLESITRAWLIESMNTDKWSLQVIEHNGKTIDFLFQESKPLQWGKKRKTYIPESKIPIPSRSNYDAAIQVPEAECDTNQKWIVERYEKDTYFYNALLLSMDCRINLYFLDSNSIYFTYRIHANWDSLGIALTDGKWQFHTIDSKRPVIPILLFLATA